ncbi:MAG: TetR/AcrR family transcriptional regulator [Oligoflexia bacterium]|nr:TetR/AcrR family transcriptional regulator [Oligoflexia bacterium]
MIVNKAVRAEEPNTLDRILVNALEHFSNFGYVGASVREITQAAHVTKPTLYYYFKNKEELYRGIANSCSEKIYSGLKESISGQGTVAHKFLNLVTVYNGLCDDDLPAVKFMFLISFTPGRGIPDVGIHEFNNKITDLVKEIVQTGVTKGEVPNGRAECLSLLLNGLLATTMSSRVMGTPIPMTSLEKAISCALVGGP